jgi:quercetin dioxygenase-like cupin family protein
MNPHGDNVIPDAVLCAMLCDVAPQPPAASAAARLKRNTLRRLASAPHVVKHDANWRPFVDKAEMKVLFDDGASRSWLVRMQPGGELPRHAHDDGDEECVVLAGELRVNGLRYGPGDYTVALRGSTHHSVRTVSGALFFLRSASPRAATRRAGARAVPG